MSFLAPLTGLIAAGIAVPLLALMYFLKLKRKSLPISSTFLWKRAVRDLQVNSPFQKIRWNVLLLLQLLLLSAVLLALARPVISLESGPAKRYVILIDRSASMNATDVKPTRLAEAKRQAKELVDNLRSRPTLSLDEGSDQAMVVAFDEHAKVMCNFTSSAAQLKAAIDAVEPSDGPSMLSEAVAVAKAFTGSSGTDAADKPSESPAQFELFSDGQIADAAQISLGNGQLNFHRLGKSNRNLAITA
ncbi:MAG: VWA domain-containing protein, partial [Planctomycetaceae bacterium]